MTDQATFQNAILPRQQLHAALAAVLPVVERRPTVPILDCAMIRMIEGGGAVVQATDLDMTATARIPDAHADAGFAAAMPAHVLRDVEKRAPASGRVTIGATERMVQRGSVPPRREASAELDFDGLRVTLDGQPAANWPELAIEGEITGDFQLATTALLDALQAVALAISTEETRFYLNGVFFHRAPANGVQRYHGNRGMLRFVATDGHRMSVHHVPAPEGCEAMPGVIIPRKTVSLLQKLAKAKDAPEHVHVLVNSAKARFTIGTVDVVTKLIDGTFPDYERVVPTGNPTAATVERNALVSAVNAVSCISSERGRAVKLAFEAGKVTVSVSNPDAGRAETTVPCAFDGEPLEIGFSSRYLLDVLAAVGSETVTLWLGDAGSPVLFRAKPDSATSYVQMPMRV